MYKIRIIFLIIFSFILLIGCAKDNRNENLTQTDDQALDLTKQSTSKVVDQQPSDDAKQFINQYDEITTVYAINDQKELMIAIEIDHHERLDLTDIEKKLKKSAKKQFDDLHVTLSTDKKSQIELKELENKLATNDISEKDLSEKITELKNLLKEET